MYAYRIGYITGRILTRAVLLSTGVKTAVIGYRTLSKVAKVHKITSIDPAVVTKNSFECLEYID